MAEKQISEMHRRAADYLTGYMSAKFDESVGEAIRVNPSVIEQGFVDYVTDGDENRVPDINEARYAMREVYGMTSAMFAQKPGEHN